MHSEPDIILQSPHPCIKPRPLSLLANRSIVAETICQSRGPIVQDPVKDYSTGILIIFKCVKGGWPLIHIACSHWSNGPASDVKGTAFEGDEWLNAKYHKRN